MVSDSRPVLRPPQFGLRTLLILITCCGLGLSLAQWVSPAAVGGLAFLAVAVGCHVAGNAIGSRLRQIGDLPDAAKPAPVGDRPRSRPQPHQFAAPTQLSRRQRLGWIALVAALAGLLVGGVAGGWWTWQTSRGPVGPMNIGTGVIAFGVLGGMTMFGVATFCQVVAGALWQALQHPQPLAPTESAPEVGG